MQIHEQNYPRTSRHGIGSTAMQHKEISFGNKEESAKIAHLSTEMRRTNKYAFGVSQPSLVHISPTKSVRENDERYANARASERPSKMIFENVRFFTLLFCVSLILNVAHYNSTRARAPAMPRSKYENCRVLVTINNQFPVYPMFCVQQKTDILPGPVLPTCSSAQCKHASCKFAQQRQRNAESAANKKMNNIVQVEWNGSTKDVWRNMQNGTQHCIIGAHGTRCDAVHMDVCSTAVCND